jgi:hypothetical protein
MSSSEYETVEQVKAAIESILSQPKGAVSDGYEDVARLGALLIERHKQEEAQRKAARKVPSDTRGRVKSLSEKLTAVLADERYADAHEIATEITYVTGRALPTEEGEES